MIACEMGPRTVLSRSLKAGFTRRQGQAAVGLMKRRTRGSVDNSIFTSPSWLESFLRAAQALRGRAEGARRPVALPLLLLGLLLGEEGRHRRQPRL